MRLCGRSKQMEQQSFYIEFHIRMQIDLNGSPFSSTKSLIRTLFTGNNTLIFGIRLTKVKRCISHFMFGVVHNCKHTAGDKDVLLTFYSAIYFVFYSIAVVLSSIPLYQRTAVGLQWFHFKFKRLLCESRSSIVLIRFNTLITRGRARGGFMPLRY